MSNQLYRKILAIQNTLEAHHIDDEYTDTGEAHILDLDSATIRHFYNVSESFREQFEWLMKED